MRFNGGGQPDYNGRFRQCFFIPPRLTGAGNLLKQRYQSFRSYTRHEQ